MTQCQICLHHRPRRARKEGSRSTSAAPLLSPNLHFPNVPALRIGRQVRIENGGSVTLHFEPVNLRPRETVMRADLVLLAQSSTLASTTATWQATSTGLRC